MIQTIRVHITQGPDLIGDNLLKEISSSLKTNDIKKIRSAKVYRVEGLSEKDARKLAELAFCENINQAHTINQPIYSSSEQSESRSSRLRSNNNNYQTIEIAYKPGVMNPEAQSILKSARDLGFAHLRAADSSREYTFFGKITREQILEIIQKLNLYNSITEHIVEKEPTTLHIAGNIGKILTIPIWKMNDSRLLELSKDNLFLNLEEMQIIKKYFEKIKRDPTDCELEMLAQTWSEHCVHKTFRAKLTIDGKKKQPLIKRIKKTAKGFEGFIVSAFEDNSGVIDFFDGYAVCGKVETHNSPSAIEPYGGAMTGSGGVFRDILGTGQGAQILISTDIFCFAPPTLSKKELPPGCLPPDYLLKRVVAGVQDYGNRVGIPTNNGSVHFHPDFRAKPTVAVGAYGIIEKKRAQKGIVKPKDLVLTLGGKTGRDGIHGATFSSAEMTDRTINVSGSAVQIGNAIEEKRTIDAIQILRDKGYIRAITDCGAGGYSSAIGEMGKETGVKVFLEKVPLKYSGLAPWEIFLSESQERMVIAIDPKNRQKVLNICKLYNVEGVVIGEFTKTKRLEVFYKEKEVADLSMAFLHDGLPQRKMIGRTLSNAAATKKTAEKLPTQPNDFKAVWKKVLGHGNVCSKEAIVRLYDHNVQGTTALHPFSGADFDGPSDGSIIKPFLNKPYGLATTHGLNPALNQIDPYAGSIWAITEAVSNYVAIGGDLRQAALIDNFIWPFPDAESLADLDKAVDACTDMARLLKMPFVSGKDSLSSTYRYKDGRVLKIPPVLLISVFGRIKDVTKTMSSDFKNANSVIVLIGKPDTTNLGGTTYFDITKSSMPKVPIVAIKILKKALQAITYAIQTNSVLAVHDISEGGIAVTLSEMCFGGRIGAEIDIKQISPTRPDFIFFSETPGTFLVEVRNEKTAKKLFKNIPHSIIGKTNNSQSITVKFGEKILAHAKISDLKKSWQQPMKEYFS